MRVDRLHVEGLRIVDKADMAPGPLVNGIWGANGSGKSSLLEALYLAGYGRSFRSRSARPIIRDGAPCTRVVVEMVRDDGRRHRIGLEKDRQESRVRCDAQPVKRLSDLMNLLPIELITPDTISLIDGPPDARRQLLDRLVFHVEHLHLMNLQRYATGLRQRNAALSRRASAAVCKSWDPELAAAGEKIHQHRLVHFDRWLIRLASWWAKIWPDLPLTVSLRPGFDADLGLAPDLGAHFDSDYQQGFTGIGPHRFDIRCAVEGVAAKDFLSRGQQKALAICMVCAAVDQMGHSGGERPIVLFDDLAAELDGSIRSRLLTALVNNGHQVFATATELSVLQGLEVPPATLFHVKQGQVG